MFVLIIFWGSARPEFVFLFTKNLCNFVFCSSSRLLQGEKCSSEKRPINFQLKLPPKKYEIKQTRKEARRHWPGHELVSYSLSFVDDVVVVAFAAVFICLFTLADFSSNLAFMPRFTKRETDDKPSQGHCFGHLLCQLLCRLRFGEPLSVLSWSNSRKFIPIPNLAAVWANMSNILFTSLPVYGPVSRSAGHKVLAPFGGSIWNQESCWPNQLSITHNLIFRVRS